VHACAAKLRSQIGATSYHGFEVGVESSETYEAKAKPKG